MLRALLVEFGTLECVTSEAQETCNAHYEKISIIKDRCGKP